MHIIWLYLLGQRIHPLAAGGDSKTLMFVQISPSEQDLGETLSSLNFATRVRGVELGPAKKQIDMGELQRMKMMVSSKLFNRNVLLVNYVLDTSACPYVEFFYSCNLDELILDF